VLLHKIRDSIVFNSPHQGSGNQVNIGRVSGDFNYGIEKPQQENSKTEEGQNIVDGALATSNNLLTDEIK
jgi:hypothetical protein